MIPKITLNIEISSNTFKNLELICHYLELTNLERYDYEDAIQSVINYFYEIKVK